MAELKRKIRWGVLGYAKIARENVIPAILRSANAELHLLASRDGAKAAEARARFPGLQTCGSYEELLRDPAVDAVYIPLPNNLHREWTIKAAEHGKHILCEKPLALTAAEAREMVDACAAHRVTLMEAFMYRYTDRTRQVQAVVRSGALGEIKHLRASFCFMLANPASIKLRPELGGGALYDIGCYPINFAGLVADEIAGRPGASRPKTVAAACTREGGVDTSFSALLRYPSGLAAALHCSIRSHRSMGAALIGTEGTLEVPDTFLDPAGTLTLVRGDERREIPVAESDRYRLEVEDFSAALQEGRPPLLGLAESVRNLEIIDRLFAAS
jgi:predicted dehydrogenase